MNINVESVPTINENVRVRSESFGLLLVSKRTPILALNRDSMQIWNYFDGRKTVGEIASELNRQIDGDLAQTTEIVKCFTESCYDLGLIYI